MDDTGGWDGGDLLRVGSRFMLVVVNTQQWLLLGNVLMCEALISYCNGITGEQFLLSRMYANHNNLLGFVVSAASSQIPPLYELNTA